MSDEVTKISDFPSVGDASDFENIYIAAVKKVGDTYQNIRIPISAIRTEWSKDSKTILAANIDDVLANTDGADTGDTEFVYLCSTGTPDKNPPSPPSDASLGNWKQEVSQVVKDFTYGTYIYTCYRHYNNENKLWESWQGPYVWSYYGTQGKDGSSVEFIFLLSSVILENTDTYWDGKISINSTEYQQNDYVPKTYNWTDDPDQTSKSFRYQYMSLRRKTSDGKWEKFTSPKIWSFYSEDGKEGKSHFSIYSPDPYKVDPSIGTTVPSDWTTSCLKNSVWMSTKCDYTLNGTVTWGAPIRITGTQGTSIKILGTFEDEQAFYAGRSAVEHEIGDAYLVGDSDGTYHLWSYAGKDVNNNDIWIDCGTFNGTSGKSAYVHIKYSGDKVTFLPSYPETVLVENDDGSVTETTIEIGEDPTAAYVGFYTNNNEEDFGEPGMYVWQRNQVEDGETIVTSSVFTRYDPTEDLVMKAPKFKNSDDVDAVEVGVDINNISPNDDNFWYDTVNYDGAGDHLHWYDGIPPVEKTTIENQNGDIITVPKYNSVWESRRTFSSTGKYTSESWSVPRKVVDCSDMDVCYCAKNEYEYDPPTPGTNGENEDWKNAKNTDEDTKWIWQAVSYYNDGAWGSWNITKIKGEEGVSIINTYVFCKLKNNDTPAKLSNEIGTFEEPSPENYWTSETSGTLYYWYDYIPDGEGNLWMCCKTISSDGEHDTEWSEPQKMVDDSAFDVCYYPYSKNVPDSPPKNDASVTSGQNQGDNLATWHNVGNSNDYWMATSHKVAGIWSDWTITRIKGEDAVFSNYYLVSDNDNIVLDIETGAADISNACDTTFTIWQGTGIYTGTDLTLSVEDSSLPDILKANFDSGGKVLKYNKTSDDNIPKGEYYVSIAVTNATGSKVASRKQNISVKNIGTPGIHTLRVTPNIVTLDHDGSADSFSDIGMQVTMSLLKDLKSSDIEWNAASYDFQAKAYTQSGELVHDSGILTNSDCNFETFIDSNDTSTPNVTDASYIVIQAFYKNPDGDWIIVDLETVDIVKNGEKGPPGTGSTEVYALWNYVPNTITDTNKNVFGNLTGKFTFDVKDVGYVIDDLSIYLGDTYLSKTDEYTVTNDVLYRVVASKSGNTISIDITGYHDFGDGTYVEGVNATNVYKIKDKFLTIKFTQGTSVEQHNYALTIPTGHYFAATDDGTYNMYSSDDSFSEISQSIDSINLNVSAKLSGNLFTGLVDGTGWSNSDGFSISEVGTLLSRVTLNSSNHTSYFTKTISGLKKNTKYIISWYGLSCTSLVINNVAQDIIAPISESILNITNNRYYCLWESDKTVADIVFNYNVKNNLSISLNMSSSYFGTLSSSTYGSSSTSTSSTSSDTSKDYLIYLVKPKFELNNGDDTPSNWNLSNTDSITSSNLSLTATGITATVKDELSQLLSQISLTSDSILETVSSELGTAGFEINSSGTTFSKPVFATNFSVLDGTSGKDVVMEFTTFDQASMGSVDGFTSDSSGNAVNRDGMPVIIIHWSGLKYVLNPLQFTSSGTATETWAYRVTAPTWSAAKHDYGGSFSGSRTSYGLSSDSIYYTLINPMKVTIVHNSRSSSVLSFNPCLAYNTQVVYVYYAGTLLDSTKDNESDVSAEIKTSSFTTGTLNQYSVSGFHLVENADIYLGNWLDGSTSCPVLSNGTYYYIVSPDCSYYIGPGTKLNKFELMGVSSVQPDSIKNFVSSLIEKTSNSSISSYLWTGQQYADLMILYNRARGE